MFVCKVGILKSKENDEPIRGILDFISIFADKYMKLYLEVSREKKFACIISVK